MMNIPKKLQSGVSLVEVLVAVIVFAIGLLAIAALQGKLVRGGADAKARTVAANLAEQQLEEFRSFTLATLNTYGDITAVPKGSANSVTVSGVDFKTWWDVDDYYFPPAGGAAVLGVNPVTGGSDFKMVRIHVDWTDPTGAVQETLLEDIIPNAPPSDSLLTVSGAISLPPPDVLVDNSNPPEPQVIVVHLDDDTSKRTSQPLAELQRGSQNTVTKFNAVTFTNQDTGPPMADRREEFLSVNCRCTLGVDDGVGFTPAAWNGDQWVAGQAVTKPVGLVDDNFDQPLVCDRCCRDHHDGSGQPGYDPFRPSDTTANGDHSHFNFDTDTGSLIPADSPDNPGGEYLEACTMVRVGGVFQATTDFNLENLLVLPIEYLESSEGISNYQNYVESFVEDYVSQLTDQYPQQRPTVNLSDPADVGTVSTSSVPPPAANTAGQQFLARGIYINLMDQQVLDRINCRLGNLDPDATPACDGGDPTVTGDGADAQDEPVLPLVPFQEINVTTLANWSEDDAGASSIFVTRDPFVVPNGSQDITSENLDRGRAIHCTPGTPSSDRCADNKAKAIASMQRSNTGLLANSNAIDPDDSTVLQDGIDIDFTLSQPAPTRTAEGALSLAPQVHGVEVSNISVVGSADIFCTRPEPSRYKCLFENNADTGTISVSNYNSVNRLGEVNNYMACSGDVPYANGVTSVVALPVVSDGTPTETTIYQFTAMPNSTFTLDIQIKKTGC